jgi:hemoglobin
MHSAQPDLDSRPRIELFVDLFYQRLLADEQLSPLFLDVARVDLEQHLPHIKDYWCKLLLGESGYRRHTMQIHRQLHGKRSLTTADFQRWLGHFHATLDENFQGPYTEKARRIAIAIAANMEKGLPPAP